ncbi:MAG TPA: hypothetical protein VM915_05740 [Verrucomicrobiae bacterium]|nr:hypothetical protein [Verrucomicrobiae bacterium]
MGGDTTLGLFISCTKCNHAARVRLDVALRLWGERAFSRDIARDLRCSRCGARAASLQVMSDPRPSWVIAEDPGGGFLMGPKYSIVDPPLSPASVKARERGWLGSLSLSKIAAIC